jgi:hypothetical protein
VQERELSFTDASPQAFIDGELRDHPAWLAAAATLHAAGTLADVREEAVGILAAANDAHHGFRVRSRYVVFALRRE